MGHVIRPVAAACVLACAAPVFAQPALLASADPALALEALLGTEIEGASRRVEKSLDAPASVSVIGRKESDALNHVTLADMLARLPGTYITTTRSYSGVGLRGFNRPGDYNARILMAIDGYRVNDALYDQALPEFEYPIVAAWIKRLEMVSGPASSVYGGNALLGVVNAVTLDGADAPGLGLRATAQGAGSGGLTAQYGLQSGNTDLFVGLAWQRLAGETLVLPELAGPSLPDGRVAGLDGTRYGSLMAKLRHGPWRLTAVSQARTKDIAVAPFGTVPGAAGTRYGDRYAYGELAYDGAWQDDWRTQLRVNFSRSRFDGRYVFEDATAGRYLNRDIGAAAWVGLDARLHWRGWLNHAPLFGIDTRRTLRGEQINEDVDPAAVYLDRNDRSTQLGLYAQDQIRLSEKSTLTLGARVDHVQGQRAEWSPRIALVHRAGANESVKLMVGRAFRAPNLYERFYDDGGISQVANPGLLPERVNTVELAWERALGQDARLSVSAYRYQVVDIIELVPFSGDVSRYENVSKANTHGIDLEVEQRLASGWQWRASLSLTRALSGGLVASNSPRWLFKGHVLAPLAPGWSAAWQWTSMARRESPRGPVPAYLTADAVLRFAWTPTQSLSLTARNLGDRATYDPASAETRLLRMPRERRAIALDWRAAF
jgi:iron complex outermembrane receptor protein